MHLSKGGEKIKMKDVLIHHGILGQKWGVRRYQEEDGTLTPLGKQRYAGKNHVGKMEAMTEDRSMLLYRAGGGKLPTLKETLKINGHEDRYKTANEVFNKFASDTNPKQEVTRAVYHKMSFRMKDLKESGLADTKGISLVANYHSSVPGDVDIRYRYYTDDAIEPSYYDTIEELKTAIKEKEKAAKKKKKVTNTPVVEKRKTTNDNAKVKNLLNNAISAIKNFPSSVLSVSKSAIDQGKSLVDSVLKKLKK